MIYENYKRNHVIFPEREKALEEFLNQDYKGMQHKLKNGFNSNSEDALTWSCFDVLENLSHEIKMAAMCEIFEDAYQGTSELQFNENELSEDQIQIHIGKQYTGFTSKESTEVDASIELPGKLIFIEAKLYSSVSVASPPEKPHDQIARKLRVGLDSPLQDEREFFFIFLDIAPYEKLNKRKKLEEVMASKGGSYHDKWKSAWLFKYYKFGRNNSLSPLEKALAGIDTPAAESVANNMGWLTWSDLFKTTLRATILNSTLKK